MNCFKALLIFFILLAGPAGCVSMGKGPTSESKPAETGQYDINSWQQMISKDCLAFFDGCNTCRRNPDTGLAACTRKACVAYAKPYCLDEEASAGTTGGRRVPAPAQTISYTCDGGSGFTVSYGEYRSGDQRSRLKKDQIMFSDHQERSARPLNRVRSASGKRYSDGNITLFAKGKEAVVQQGGELLYTNCRKHN